MKIARSVLLMTALSLWTHFYLPSHAISASSVLDQRSHVAVNPIDAEIYLKKFHRNPKQVMNTRLAKRDEHGKRVPPDMLPAEVPRLNRSDLLDAKKALRGRICGAQAEGCRPMIDVQDRFLSAMSEAHHVARFFFRSSYLKNLLEMERRSLLKAVLKEAPWSDSFWPMAKGMIARRWREGTFPNSRNWIDNYAHYLSVPGWLISPANLSPAEKYDLLMGDPSRSLTEAMWAAGKYHYDRKGHVPGWTGLCHGWAPASFMTPNPQREVTVQTPSGQPVTFYPSDLKALAALAWGSTPPTYKVLGSRCQVNDPEEDHVGRVKDEGCFDVNPGAWHIAIVNQMGVDGRSLVFDATFDLQVWNYPVYAYQYHYFNPQALTTSETMAGALVSIPDYRIDKFKSHRSSQARYVVGVAMDVTYAIPTQPSSKPVATSRYHTVKYVYDLELDQHGQILGGEWYSNFHPDFIWNLPKDGQTRSDGEKGLVATWDGVGPVPVELREAALASSSKSQVVGVVVDTLLKMARIPEAPGEATESEEVLGDE